VARRAGPETHKNLNKPQLHPTHRLLSHKSYLQRQNPEHQIPPNRSSSSGPSDQTLRRRHRRVDKPEKPRDRRQDPTGPPERHHHLDKHLENQAKPSQIPVHPNVLLRSQVPPPSPPSPTHPLPRRHLFQKLHPQPGRQRNPQKIPQPSQPPVQDSRAHPWVRFENPVAHLQILHPSRHRIPRPHLRHPIPGPPPPNLRLREKNAPQDLSTPRQVPLRQPAPGNQHNPDPIPPQRTPEPLRDTHSKLQQRPRHPNPVHLV
jgi:hypothetical protein